MFNRTSGVLMPVFSLPGKYGIGSFSKEAKEFCKKIKEMGFSVWQVLPLSPCDSFNSPYASVSAFAGNPFFIDLEILNKKGLISNEELLNSTSSSASCDYKWLKESRIPLLKVAFSRLGEKDKKEVSAFMEKNRHIKNFALFSVLKDENNQKPWHEWEEGIRSFDLKAVNSAFERLNDEVLFYAFLQKEFFSQWLDLKNYANSIGVSVIGDMPIYPTLDSVDVWANQKYFKLDSMGFPLECAGVPPDYFCKDGQFWGNPLYDWKKLKDDNYSWWIDRIKFNLSIFDAVRIDHFRAFSSYFSIPKGKTAKEGKWIKGAGIDFFNTVKKELGDVPIIAEDLGDIDDDVIKLLNDTGFYGMRVLQFAFTSHGDNLHLPHNYPKHSIAYTGTHDNNTTLGWLWEQSDDVRKYALSYCGFSGDWGIGGKDSPSVHAMLRAIFTSPSNIAICPIQDIFGYGGDTRINTPGIAEKNWEFRISENSLNEVNSDFFKELNSITHRRNALI